MTLQDWGALGELVGGFAIIVSLIYVALQIKQSTQASRAATRQSFSTQYGDLISTITRADFRDIFWRGLKNVRKLENSELVAFFGYLGSLFRMWESFFYQKQEGTFDKKIFDSWVALLVDTFANAGVREYWAIRKHQFSNEFVEFVDQQVATTKPKPMYPDDA